MKTFRRAGSNLINWLWITLAFGVVALFILWFLGGRVIAHRLLSNDSISVSPITLSNSNQTVFNGLLKINPMNPRYFMDGSGKAVFFTGLHTWNNLQDMDSIVFDYSEYLSKLQMYNLNFIRLWVWEQPKGITTASDPAQPNATLTPEIFKRTGPGIAADGGLKFDVTQYNQVFFDRLRQRVIDAGNKGIYVSIMLFDGWSVEKKAAGANPWTYHPFNINNNVNGLNGDPNQDQSGAELHTLQIPAITAVQEAYVRKVVDTVNDLDNVLYEISNESGTASTAWQYHMIDYIHSYEAGKPKQHPVGMTSEWPGGNNSDLFASPADWVAPNGDEGYGDNPPVATGNKVVILDTDHIWGLGGDRAWAWKSFMRGYNILYMDPWNGTFIPASADEDLRVNMGYIRSYASQINLTTMLPQPTICSTGYCLADTTSDNPEVMAYLPAGETTTSLLEFLGMQSKDHKRISSFYLPLDSEVIVKLPISSVGFNVEWFNPADGMIINDGTVPGDGTRAFIAPFSGDAVLYVYQSSSPAQTSELTLTNIP